MDLQVGVKALLQDSSGKFLLLRRSREAYGDVDGEWDMPGGRIHPGSPLLENLAREISEETGLSLEGEPRLCAAQDILRSPGRHVVRLTYRGRIQDGSPVLDGENTEARFFASRELKELGRELDVYLRDLLERGAITL